MRVEVSLSDVQPLIRDYDLILSEGRGVASRIIQFATGSRKSHVGVARWAGKVLCVFESTDKNGIKDIFTKTKRNGSQVVDLQSRVKFYKGTVLWRPIEGPRNQWQIDELEVMRRETSGILYEKNMREFVGASFRLIVNRENRGTIFCSELVAFILKRGRILCEQLPSNQYTPEDFSIEADRELAYCPGYVPSRIEYILKA